MTCGACGGENRATAAFCVHCGQSLASSCPACGAENPAGWRFCESCGSRAPDVVPMVSAPAAPAPVDRTQGQPAERRPVTVLFADAMGSTALAERVGDEEMYRLMQGCVARMAESVERHEGTVTQFRGDGIMALFGAPVAHEDSAVRAVTAALEMQAALSAVADELRIRLGEAVSFRIGVHTGPVVVGRVGDDVLMDYTAIGDTANVAARMEQSAEPGAVYMSDATWRAVRGFVEAEPVGDLTVKGKSSPVAAYRAVRRTGVRSRLDVALARGLTPFVGREHELALLEEFVARLSTGKGRVVLVTGEAGIGKSRMLLELRSRLPEGTQLFEGQCSAVDRKTPWLPLVDLLRRAFGVDEEDGADEIGRKIDERAGGWSAEARGALPYLKWLLHADDDGALDDLDPRERRAGIFEAMRTTMLDGASRRPIVVAIEDLHWADDASEGAIAAMAEAVADAPVLLVLTYRPEHTPAIGDRPWYTRLALDQLQEDQAAALAANVLAASSVSDEVRGLITARSEGNPLFVEEVTAALVETGALRSVDDRYELAVPASAVDIPGTLHEVILARIDRLEREAREALQLAAVIGREFTRRLLDRIAEMPVGLDGHLEELQRLELIRQKSFFPELAFLFKHALTHDVAYSTLLTERRRRLHRVVAEAIEELYGDRLVEHYEPLARHWKEAGEDAKALHYLELAIDQAEESFALAEGVAYLGEAAEVAGRLGDHARRAQLLERRGVFLFTLGDMTGAASVFDEAAAIHRTLGSVDPHAGCLAWRGYCELYLHDFERAETTLAEAIDSATEPDTIVRAASIASINFIVRNKWDDYEALAARITPFAGRVGPETAALRRWIVLAVDNWTGRWRPDPDLLSDQITDIAERVAFMWGEGLYFGGAGRYDEALETLAAAISLGERSGEVVGRARALNTFAWVLGELGDVDGAIEWNRRCIEFCEPLAFPDPEIEFNARLNLADCYLRRGRFDEADAQLALVERVVHDPEPPEVWMLWRYSQHYFHSSGELALMRGDADGALAFARRCLELAEGTDSRRNVVKGRRLEGQALLVLGRVDEARTALAGALDLAREIGNPPQLWMTLAAMAQLEDAAGDDERARTLRKEAHEVVQAVADRLSDERLARTLVDSTTNL